MFPRSLVAASLAAASLAVAAPSAPAAISMPPAFPHEVTVFPERDFVTVDGWPANTDVRVDVLRNGVNVGTATWKTDAAGLAEINHPGGGCWTGFTPDILPGDVVQATEIANPANGDATRVAPVRVEQGTAAARNAVTAPGTLNARTLAAGAPDVVFSGASQPDATAVSLSITDGTNTIDIPAGSVVLAGGSWTAPVPAARLAALSDGQLTVA